MKTKLFLKVSLLVFGLIFVIIFRNSITSGTIGTSLQDIFNFSTPKLNWCAEHVVDVVWISPDVPKKLKSLSPPTLREDYCQLTTEAIHDLQLDKVSWKPLAESYGAAGQKTLLEWNPESGIFQSGGLPFKSSGLLRELVDK